MTLYLLFLIGLGTICFFRQLPGDFDRYIYEAIVRNRTQSLQVVYPIVKHSNPRAEASSVLDSPEHLGQLEPLYAIRPVYIWAIEGGAGTGLSIQKAISLVSALSLVGIGLVLFVWTRATLPSALIMASPAIVVLGRAGTPDALSALFILSSAWALIQERFLPGLLLLLGSIWVRTDNVLLVLAVLAWLAWSSKIHKWQAGVLVAVALFSVFFINHFSGNYGWSVLFHYSFIGGKSPADVSSHLSWREYAFAFAKGLEETGGQQISIWILLGIAAWHWLPEGFQLRILLLPVALASLARLVLFPAVEDRYFAWAYLIVGVCFLKAMRSSTAQSGGDEATGFGLWRSSLAKKQE
jgi:hypothetical protein